MPVPSRTFLLIAAIAVGTLLAAGCNAAAPAPAAAPTAGAAPTVAVPPAPTAAAATAVPAMATATAPVATATAVPPTLMASPPAATPMAAQTEVVPTAASVAADVVVVNMQDIKFQPLSATVRVGQAVEWRNLDSAPHTATSRVPQGVFDSNIMNQGDTYRFTPTAPGTIEYWCLVHPDMLATLVVQ